jgi:hypothetical protein
VLHTHKRACKRACAHTQTGFAGKGKQILIMKGDLLGELSIFMVLKGY